MQSHNPNKDKEASERIKKVKLFIDRAIKGKRDVFVRYSGGSKPNEVRQLHIIKWKYSAKTAFQAQELGITEVQSYTTSKVVEASFDNIV